LDIELIKRVGYIAARVAEMLPDCRVSTGKGPYEDWASFKVRWDDASLPRMGEYISHAQILQIQDPEILAKKVVERWVMYRSRDQKSDSWWNDKTPALLDAWGYGQAEAAQTASTTNLPAEAARP
jgi:hypothetical protein